jgi:hypothetical protein
MGLKELLKSIFMPTVPKIALYAALSFVVPGVLKICVNDCSNKVVPLAGYRLVLNPDQYIFSFPRMILLFITAYLASALFITIVNAARKKGEWQQPKV